MCVYTHVIQCYCELTSEWNDNDESEQFIENNDNVKVFARDFKIKQKEGEREQNIRETEKVCVKDRALQGEGDSIGNKVDC